MMCYNKIILFVLVITWFPQNSESLPRDPCQDFLLNFERTLVSKWKIIRDLYRENKPAEMKYHSKIGSEPEQKEIGDSGSLFVEASKLCSENSGNARAANDTNLRATCPYLAPITCNKTAIYRTIDGSCNNLEQPYWGKAHTPYRRFQAAEYADGIAQPRCESVVGGPLPGPRDISVKFHRMSSIKDLDKELTHLTMTFGQFVNHELGRTALFNNAQIDCCETDEIISCPNTLCKDCVEKVFYERCLPMAVPQDDPYFSQFNRTCLPFTRALPTPNLHCQFGPKEQLNGQTSHIDCSQVYGTSIKDSNSLRTMTGGLLQITPTNDLDLLPHDNKTFCRKPNNYCFIAGDVRVNQNQMLITLHTLFLREHNRIAELLARADPSLNDESLFQKARHILIAQAQHIVYSEYLPLIIGETRMKNLGLDPLTEGYTRYEPDTQVAIFNAHIAAAFRFGHSMIRRTFSNGRGDQILLSPSFGVTDPFYQPGDAASGFATGLVNDPSQKTDRLLTDQVTDKLFEASPGQGNDLASTNIQRGRDVGLKPYTQWRSWCGLDVPRDFNGLTDHPRENRERLEKIYKDVRDIDLWTGGLSEEPLDGANVGPTFACIIGEQFRVLKYGDRFWYEHEGPNRLTPNQLASIRNTSLSRILCDNTNIKRIQTDPFLLNKNSGNDLVNCDSLAALDVCSFIRRWGDWSDWFAGNGDSKYRQRSCVSPVKGPCACEQNQIEIEEVSYQFQV